MDGLTVCSLEAIWSRSCTVIKRKETQEHEVAIYVKFFRLNRLVAMLQAGFLS